MQLVVKTCVLFIWTLYISTISAGPLPAAQQQPDQVDDLKAKLETLQKLLSELSKKKDPSEHVVGVPSTQPTTTPPTTTTTTTAAPPVVENVAMRDLPDVDSAEDSIRKLVSQLTPADIAALQVVRAKLINLKNRLDSENQVSEINKVLRNLVGAHQVDRKSVESELNKMAPQPSESENEDWGHFLSHPLPDNKLGAKENTGSRREQPPAHLRANEGSVLPVETSNGSFGPFVRELYRQNVLHTVKKNLLQSLKLAQDSGISLKEVLKALEENRGQDRGAGKAETELQSLIRHQ